MSDEKKVKKVAPATRYVCNVCKTAYSNNSNLKRHVQKFHPANQSELAPSRYKTAANYKFPCSMCKRNFNYEKHLKFHMKQNHKAEVPSETLLPKNSKPKKCPLCEHQDFLPVDLISHFEQAHQLEIIKKDMKMPTADFERWKMQLESDTNSRFVRQYMKKCNSVVIEHYVCHRSGVYLPEGKGLRRLKKQGSVKINSFCPASIKMRRKESDDKCMVHLIETHVGHKNDIGHLYLTESERKAVAEKIAAKVPFDSILDEICESMSHSPLQRIHLLKKKDLYNIRRSFNLCGQPLQYSDIAAGIDKWVNKVRTVDPGCVLYYKTQSSASAVYPEVKSDDLILVINTEEQRNMLKKYGADCICIDGTSELNSYGVELYTVLVLDERRHGLPCAFLLTNRSDAEIISLFFYYIREAVGPLSPKVFMSGTDKSYLDAWAKHMNQPTSRLFLTWHVDKAWRKHLSKIKTKEKQAQIYKVLRGLLQEKDSATFKMMLREFCDSLDKDPDAFDFAEHFKENYLNNTPSWACCFRLQEGLSTSNHIERLYKTVKSAFLNGRKAKRIDMGIEGLLTLVKVKLSNRFHATIQNELADIINLHKSSLELDIGSVRVVEGGWEVTDSVAEAYFVKKNETCTCQLICPECNACLHRYSCSCVESSVKSIMCKHVHLVGRFKKERGQSNNLLALDGLCEAEKYSQLCNSGVQGDVSTDLSNTFHLTPVSTVLSEEKEKLKNRFVELLDGITSLPELAKIKEIVESVPSTLAAMRSNNQPTVVLENTTIGVGSKLILLTKTDVEHSLQNPLDISNQPHSLIISAEFMDGLN